MKVLTFSKEFPINHPKASEPTFFVERILNLLHDNQIVLDNIHDELKPFINDFELIGTQRQKHHTVRPGSRWKPGDMASLRVWSDKPYRSKQIEFAQVEIKKVWDIEISEFWFINDQILEHGQVAELAKNDGLAYDDFIAWFSIHPKTKDDVFRGQVICWSDRIEYGKPSLQTEKTKS